jgi:hypothetical protein
MTSTILNKLIDDFSHLPLEDKEYAVAVIKKQLIEAKREAIARRAKKANVHLRKRMVKEGTWKDLYEDLEK